MFQEKKRTSSEIEHSGIALAKSLFGRPLPAWLLVDGFGRCLVNGRLVTRPPDAHGIELAVMAGFVADCGHADCHRWHRVGERDWIAGLLSIDPKLDLSAADQTPHDVEFSLASQFHGLGANGDILLLLG